MTKFEKKLDKLELQNIKCREEIARLQKSLRKKNKTINDLKEAVKNIKSERDEWKVDANQLDKEKDEFIIENEKLKSQLQQQALPVVPEYVGSFLTDKSILGIANGLIPDDVISWVQEQTYYVDLEKIISHLISIKVTGFTVEKPQLFYLKNKLTGFYLFKAFGGKYGEEFYRSTINLTDDFKFTQQEIDSMQTGSYEQIEVAE